MLEIHYLNSKENHQYFGIYSTKNRNFPDQKPPKFVSLAAPQPYWSTPIAVATQCSTEKHRRWCWPPPPKICSIWPTWIMLVPHRKKKTTQKLDQTLRGPETVSIDCFLSNIAPQFMVCLHALPPPPHCVCCFASLAPGSGILEFLFCPF